MFNGLIDGALSRALGGVAPESEITEVRLRVGRQLFCATAKKRTAVFLPSGAPYVVTGEELDGVLARASDFSMYAVNDQLCRGYLSRRGVRIGVAGEGVVEQGRLMTLKNVRYMVLRVPHEIVGVSDKIMSAVNAGGYVKNTLVISPPCGGKTTMLRDMARSISLNYNTLLIDERYELAAAENGVPTLDVGDCEVVSGIVKSAAYENCVRAMSPDVIVTDEIFRREEVESVLDIIRGGVKVFASAHAVKITDLEKSPVFAPLVGAFDVIVTLSTNPVGKVLDVKTYD